MPQWSRNEEKSNKQKFTKKKNSKNNPHPRGLSLHTNKQVEGRGGGMEWIGKEAKASQTATKKM